MAQGARRSITGRPAAMASSTISTGSEAALATTTSARATALRGTIAAPATDRRRAPRRVIGVIGIPYWKRPKSAESLALSASVAFLLIRAG